jgi:putative transposase
MHLYLYTCDQICYITAMGKYISSVNSYHDLMAVWDTVKDNGPFDLVFFEIRCKYCDSKEISKFGHYKNSQRWWCKHCKRKFTDNRAPAGMKTPLNMMLSAVSMFYKGIPIVTIRHQLQDDYNYYPSESMVHKWIDRDTINALEYTKDHHPLVSNEWMVFNSPITVGPNRLWILDIVDVKTRFLLATRLSHNRDLADMRLLIESARQKAQKVPEKIIAPKKYFKGVELVCGGDTRLINTKYHREEMQTAEYWHFVIRIRRRILGRQKLLTSAESTLQGWTFYQNYVVIQKNLNEKTASQEAGINYKHETGFRIEEYRLDQRYQSYQPDAH